MKSLGDIFTTIFEKTGNLIDVFDLSYFISGVVSFSALLYWRGGALTQQIGMMSNNTEQAAVTVIACYVMGLICFTIGRVLRYASFKIGRFLRYSYYAIGKLFRCLKADSTQSCESKFITLFLKCVDKMKSADAEEVAFEGDVVFSKNFNTLLINHGLDRDTLVEAYMLRYDTEMKSSLKSYSRRVMRGLYTRLWVEIRNQPQLSDSLKLLNSSWVRAATYDGLGVALVLWAVVLCMSGTGYGDSQRLPGYYAAPHFYRDDILEPVVFAEMLVYPPDAMSKYLRIRFDKDAPQGKKMAELFKDNKQPTNLTPELKLALVALLNRELRDPMLYNNERFEGIDLTPEEKKQTLRLPQITNNSSLERLNRQLLEDVYPNILHRHFRYSRKAAFFIPGVLLLLAAGCFWEAEKHTRNQLEELVATYACWAYNNKSVKTEVESPSPEEQQKPSPEENSGVIPEAPKDNVDDLQESKTGDDESGVI